LTNYPLYRKIKGGLATFQRNTGQPHPLAGGIKTSSKKRATGSVPLTDDENSLWYGSIEIGTPPKPFTGMTLSSGQRLPSDLVSHTVDFDTGSSDLFVPAAGCETCKGHRMYDPSASSTSKDRGESFELNYGDGSSVKGEQYNDTVIIAGLKVR
jgi:cathepsin D